MKSEIECYKGTKAQMLQNRSAAMTVMTQCAHLVVVFLLCCVAYHGIPTCLHLIYYEIIFPTEQ